MSLHRLAASGFYNTLGPHVPVLSVASGDTVVMETLDAHGFDHLGRQPGCDPNPMTGPIHVEGAEPGDVLAVEIRRIGMIAPTGWTRQGLALGVVPPGRVADLPPREKIIWDLHRNEGVARPQSPPPGLSAWSAPLRPMIGCFGVAPAGRQSLTAATSGPHGGNMDYKGFSAGVTAYFPVSETGALFFAGDVHAGQGAGEIAGTGIECAAEIECVLRVIKAKPILWPRGETPDEIFTIGNARPLEDALRHATAEMLDWLMADYGLSATAAGQIMGQAVEYDIANVFNPAYSVVCRIGKRWLSGIAD